MEAPVHGCTHLCFGRTSRMRIINWCKPRRRSGGASMSKSRIITKIVYRRGRTALLSKFFEIDPTADHQVEGYPGVARESRRRGGFRDIGITRNAGHQALKRPERPPASSRIAKGLVGSDRATTDWATRDRDQSRRYARGGRESPRPGDDLLLDPETRRANDSSTGSTFTIRGCFIQEPFLI